jgi:hypothetical protein
MRTITKIKWFFIVLYRRVYASFFTCKDCIHAYDGQCWPPEETPSMEELVDISPCIYFERKRK